MSVTVSFFWAGRVGSAPTPAINRVRAKEVIAVPGTTTVTALEGEMVVVGNAEASMVAAAFGSTPDAAATAETSATSAGFPVAAGAVSDPFALRAGDKVSVKAA